jgi:tetratricopeptide (TPR) repeat protein
MLYATQLNALSVERTGMRLSAGGTSDYDDGWSWARDIAIYRAGRIHLWIQFGDLDRARESLAALAENKCAGVTRDSNFLFTTARLAQAASALDMREAATELYEAVQAYAGLYAVSDFVFSLGSMSYFLGLLAKQLELRTEARQYFERAIQANLATGHDLFALRARSGLADLLSTDRSRAERAEAITLANEVRTEAQRRGLNALRAEAQLTADRLASTPSRLTRAELDPKAARNKRMRLR